MLPENFLKQFREPSGNLGWFIGWLMAVKNTGRSRWTVHKLDFKSTDHILEIGYGPGTTVNLVAKKMTTGLIEGLDHSETMFKMASKRNRAFIEHKKVRLEKGTVHDLENSNK